MFWILIAMEFHTFGPARLTVYLIMLVLCWGILSWLPYLVLYVWYGPFYTYGDELECPWIMSIALNVSPLMMQYDNVCDSMLQGISLCHLPWPSAPDWSHRRTVSHTVALATVWHVYQHLLVTMVTKQTCCLCTYYSHIRIIVFLFRPRMVFWPDYAP